MVLTQLACESLVQGTEAWLPAELVDKMKVSRAAMERHVDATAVGCEEGHLTDWCRPRRAWSADSSTCQRPVSLPSKWTVSRSSWAITLWVTRSRRGGWITEVSEGDRLAGLIKRKDHEPGPCLTTSAQPKDGDLFWFPSICACAEQVDFSVDREPINFRGKCCLP